MSEATTYTTDARRDPVTGTLYLTCPRGHLNVAEAWSWNGMVGTYGSAAEFCDECEVAGLPSVMRYGLGQRTIPVLMPWEVPTPVHTVKEETP